MYSEKWQNGSLHIKQNESLDWRDRDFNPGLEVYVLVESHLFKGSSVTRSKTARQTLNSIFSEREID